MLPRHHHRHLLGHQFRLALAADSGGIDETIGQAITLHELIDRIASGARNWRDNCPRRSGQRVQQGRLADIGPANDRDLGLARLSVFVRAFLFGVLISFPCHPDRGL